MVSLDAFMERGAFCDILSVISATSASNLSIGTHEFTKPILSASSAEYRFAVINISFAFDGPTKATRFPKFNRS